MTISLRIASVVALAVSAIGICMAAAQAAQIAG